MKGPDFVFDDFQLKFVVAQLKKLSTDLSPVMDEIGETLQDNIRAQLGRGKTPWGDDMEPLKSRSGTPLNDTRTHIYDRITHTYDNNSVSVGMNENIGIAKTHQFGAVIVPVKAKRLAFTVGGKKVFAKKVTIPARPFLPIKGNSVDLPQAWRDDVIKALKDAIKGALP